MSVAAEWFFQMTWNISKMDPIDKEAQQGLSIDPTLLHLDANTIKAIFYIKSSCVYTSVITWYKQVSRTLNLKIALQISRSN